MQADNSDDEEIIILGINEQSELEKVTCESTKESLDSDGYSARKYTHDTASQDFRLDNDSCRKSSINIFRNMIDLGDDQNVRVIRHGPSENTMIEQLAAETIQDAFRYGLYVLVNTYDSSYI